MGATTLRAWLPGFPGRRHSPPPALTAPLGNPPSPQCVLEVLTLYLCAARPRPSPCGGPFASALQTFFWPACLQLRVHRETIGRSYTCSACAALASGVQPMLRVGTDGFWAIFATNKSANATASLGLALNSALYYQPDQFAFTTQLRYPLQNGSFRCGGEGAKRGGRPTGDESMQCTLGCDSWSPRTDYNILRLLSSTSPGIQASTCMQSLEFFGSGSAADDTRVAFQPGWQNASAMASTSAPVQSTNTSARSNSRSSSYFGSVGACVTLTGTQSGGFAGNGEIVGTAAPSATPSSAQAVLAARFATVRSGQCGSAADWPTAALTLEGCKEAADALGKPFSERILNTELSPSGNRCNPTRRLDRARRPVALACTCRVRPALVGWAALLQRVPARAGMHRRPFVRMPCATRHERRPWLARAVRHEREHRHVRLHERRRFFARAVLRRRGHGARVLAGDHCMVPHPWLDDQSVRPAGRCGCLARSRGFAVPDGCSAQGEVGPAIPGPLPVRRLCSDQCWLVRLERV